MNILEFLRPRPTLTEREVNTGLRWFIWEGTAYMGFFSITTSGILVAFALALGADNFHIGVMAARLEINPASGIHWQASCWFVHLLKILFKHTPGAKDGDNRANRFLHQTDPVMRYSIPVTVVV
jgi:hypothetical protein